MFTGIIEEVGTIAAVRDLGGGRRLSVAAKMAPELRPDQSVAINGVCQTVVAVEGTTFEVVAVEETLRKTTVGALTASMPVNLERTLQPTGRLDGHFVQGHVDATGTVIAVEKEQTNGLYRVRFEAQDELAARSVRAVSVWSVSMMRAISRKSALMSRARDSSRVTAVGKTGRARTLS